MIFERDRLVEEKGMRLNDAFNKTIDLLEEYYRVNKQDEALLSLLSDFDCSIFNDGNPVDLATYYDWEKIILSFMSHKELSESDVKKALIDFLIYYKNEFGYELENAIKYFSV